MKLQLRKKSLILEMDLKQAEADKLIELSMQRVRVSYMHRGGTVFEQIVANDSRGEFFRTAYYLSKIRNQDLLIVEEIRKLRLELAEQAKQVAKTKKEKEALKKQRKEARGKLESEKDNRDKSLVALKKQVSEVESTLSKLRAQALRLEAVVASLTGKAEDEPAQKTESRRASRLSRALSHSFEGTGLKKFKGRLPKPVSGKLIRKFGKHKAKGFKDIVFNKGVEYSTKSGAEVKSVAVGKVIFLGRMPGFGTVIILDHGKRMYSLYARVDDTRVEQGDIVGQGSKLATVEEVGGGTGLFYFEIREKGKAVDPKRYLVS